MVIRKNYALKYAKCIDISNNNCTLKQALCQEKHLLNEVLP